MGQIDTASNSPAVPGQLIPPARTGEQLGLWKWLPGLYTLRHYQPQWLRDDVVAGLVLTAVLVPVGMGYAVASGLPAIYGLYATIVPLLAYAIFGPSRVLVLGPDSSLAPVIAAVILTLAAGDITRSVYLAGMLAIFSGLLCIIAAFARLGFITELLSKPIRYGYLNGIALTVLIGQMPKLFGFSVDAPGLLAEAVAFVQGVLSGQTNRITLLVGAGTLVLILFLKRIPRVPGVLIAVVAAITVVSLFDLANQAGVTVLGTLPQGLPEFVFPRIQLSDIGPLLAGAIAIALVSFADTSVLSRTFAAKSGNSVDQNQEMFGLGAANVVAGLFQGFPISSSSSRTPVAAEAGAKTQVTGIVGALTIALMLLVAPSLLHNLPDTALAAVVIASALGLFEIADLRRLYQIHRSEFWLSITCFLGVAILGPIQGILIAVIIALLAFVWDSWRPYSAVLGKAEGVEGYHDITRYPNAELVPGLVLFRWDAPLFFANAEWFRQEIKSVVSGSPTQVRWLVVAAEPVTGIDITAADMLAELDKELQQANIELVFAELKDPVKDSLKQFGIFNKLGDLMFFATIEEAVDAYLVIREADQGVSDG
jgi:high affinity sulfate transporter 1